MTEKTLSKASIQREREMLKQRLADLDAAERLLDAPMALPSIDDSESAAEALGLMPSIKHIILREAGRPTGVTASEAAAVISAWKPNYPATNVSPKLSLYGSPSEGLLAFNNGRWFLTEKGRKELDKSKN